MKEPLVIYSLLYLVLFLLYTINRSPKPQRYAPGAGAERPPASRLELMLKEMLTDTLRIYVPLAAAALLSITFGKPGLGPQYAAWGVVVLQVLLWGGVALRQPRAKLPLMLLVLALLAYLWVLQLPFFDVLPA